MNKKTIGIVLVCMMIGIPIPYVMGDNISSDLKNEVTIECNEDSSIIHMINQIDESILAYYLEGLTNISHRDTGSENCSQAALYLYYEYRKLGLDVNIEPWTYLRYSCQNVVATLEGTNPSSDAVIILSAHYDTIGDTVGANDDGSGVAASLAIAKVLSNQSFDHTIRFIAYSGHEVGTYGSHAYAKKAYERDENIIAVLNMDMIAYANSTQHGKAIQVTGAERTEWISSFSQEIKDTYNAYINLEIQPIPNWEADHQSYYEYGYDAVTFIHPNFWEYPMHTPEDNLDKINYTYFSKVTKLILAITSELADIPIDVQIRITSPYEGYFYVFDHPLLKLPAFNIFVTGLRGMTYMIGGAVVRVNITTEAEIASVSFSIDGNSGWGRSVTEPPYEWKIKRSLMSIFPLIGKHRIGVCVCTDDGKIAYDEMDIFIITPLI